MTKTAIGYIRVSTTKQKDEGVSLDAQRKRIEDWCKLKDLTLLSIHSDNGKSGKNLKDRPGARKAIDQACETGATLVFYSLSRLSRSIRQTIEIADRLQTAGADMVSLTEPIDTTSAVGKMFFQVMAALNEFERNLASERTLEAVAYNRSKNKPIGKIPYGKSLDAGGKLIDNPIELDAIRDMHAMRKGGYSLRKIAMELEDANVFNRKGKPSWSHTVVAVILKRTLPRIC